MKCPDKPFKAAEPNAKSWLRDKGIIDEYLTIIKPKEFEKENIAFSEHALKTYGIDAKFMDSTNVSGYRDRVVINKEAFESIDFLNKVKYNGKTIDVSENRYIQEYNRQQYLKDHLDQEDYNNAQHRLNEMQEAGIDEYGDSHVLYDPTFNLFYDSNPRQVVPRGGMAKLLDNKKNSLRIAENKLYRLYAEKKEGITSDTRLKEVNNDIRRLQDIIDGNEEKKIVGLKNEIKKITKIDSRDPTLIAPFVKTDFERLQQLVTSSDPNDNADATNMIDFYLKVGDFTNPTVEHPIYTRDELYDKETGELKLSDEFLQPFRDWREQAETFSRLVQNNRNNIGLKIINVLPQVKATFDKELEEEEIRSTQGMKDTDWLSQLFLPPSKGFVNANGIIPQAIQIIINNSVNKHTSWSIEDVGKAIDNILPRVEKELAKLGYSHGIPGLRAVRWDLFRREYQNGKKTAELVSKYSIEYQDIKDRILNEFSRLLNYGQGVKGPRGKVIVNRAYKNRNHWINENNTFVNPSLLPELRDNPEFESLKHLFSTNQSEIDAHKKQLVDIVGETHYNEIVKEQTKKLQEYQAKLNDYKSDLLDVENKDLASYVSGEGELSEAGKAKLKDWELRNSPFLGAESMIKGETLTDSFGNSANLKHNIYVPNKKLEFYDTKYEQIEKNPVLKEFYDISSKALEGIYDRLDHEDKQNINQRTLALQQKEFIEYFYGNDSSLIQKFGSAFMHVFDDIKGTFGVKKEADLISANIGFDGKHEQEISKNLITQHNSQIETKFKALSTIFKAEFNKGKQTGRLNNLDKNTIIVLTESNKNTVIRLLSDYMSVEDVNKLRNYPLGKEIPLGNILYTTAQDYIVNQNSFDLPKIIKAYSDAVAQYAARKEILPIIKILENMYKSIPKVKTTKLNQVVIDKDTNQPIQIGDRNKANIQMEAFLNHVLYMHYGTKDYGIGNKKIYTQEEKKLVAELEKARDLETDLVKKNDIQNDIDRIGKFFAVSAAIDTTLIRGSRLSILGYNYNAALTDIFHRTEENFILADSGNFYSDPNLINTVPLTLLLKQGILTRTLGHKFEDERYSKIMWMANQYNILVNRTNLIQKHEATGAYSHLNKLTPYAQTVGAEILNQYPLAAAIIKDTKITAKDGTKSNVFDAFERIWNEKYKKYDVQLKPEFRTKENIDNFEKATGDAYNMMRTKISNAIADSHGDYDPLSNMQFMNSQGGASVGMFKRWLPSMFLTRFATSQTRLDLMVKNWKGRHLSHSPISAAEYGAIAMFIGMGGWIAPVVGGVAGLVFGHFAGTKNGFSTGKGLGMLAELYQINKLLFRKAIGIPLNIVSRVATNKTLIGPLSIDSRQALFDKMSENPAFTKKDFDNYQANVKDMALLCFYFGCYLAIKSYLYHDKKKDETDEDKRLRYWHNIFSNRFMELSDGLTQYENPLKMYKSITSNAALSTLDKTRKLIWDFGSFCRDNDDDIILSGENAGKSKMGQDVKKFIPGILHDPLGFGFDKQGSKQFEHSWVDPFFHSDEYKAKKKLQQLRALDRVNTEKQYMKEHEIKSEDDLSDDDMAIIKKQSNRKFGKKKKKYQTYEQYLKQHEETVDSNE